jgi:uncharacterized membrane protein
MHMTFENKVLIASKWLLVLVCLGSVVINLPLIMGLIEPNSTYGFRTSATLANREIWFEANRFMGWACCIAGVFSALAIAIRPQRWKSGPFVDVALFLVPLLIATWSGFYYLGRLTAGMP